jgi:hypothetical protein
MVLRLCLILLRTRGTLGLLARGRWLRLIRLLEQSGAFFSGGRAPLRLNALPPLPGKRPVDAV